MKLPESCGRDNDNVDGLEVWDAHTIFADWLFEFARVLERGDIRPRTRFTIGSEFRETASD